MAHSRVAERYAKALLDLANDENKTEVVYDSVSLFKNTLEENPNLTMVMDNPTVGTEKKVAIFNEIFQKVLDPITFGFVQLVLKKRRESNFLAIADSFMHLYKQQQGITELQLTTAVPIDKALVEAIVSKIKEQQGLKKVDVQAVIDPSIIGGYIAEFDNQIIDQSIESNLKQIKRRLTSAN